jgi:alpha-1,2-mannosyltransferase
MPALPLSVSPVCPVPAPRVPPVPPAGPPAPAGEASPWWRRGRLPRGRWAVAGALALLVAETGLAVWFAATHDLYDLKVYLWGGHTVAHDTQLYTSQTMSKWFTYPPFAAILFAAFAAVPVAVVKVGWELASIAAFAAACVTTVRLAGWRVSSTQLAALVAGGLLLEPMRHTLYLGQVNLFLLALVLADVRRAASGRTAGVAVGVAAAIKLTPAIFVVLFLLTGRIRAAVTAAATFAACGLAGFLVAPGASRMYWGHLFFDTSRVGIPYISNQSPYGTAARLLAGTAPSGLAYLLVPALIGAAGLVVATLAARHGDWLTAAAVTGITGLLVSPVSWTHHWVWVLPALVVLVRGGKPGKIGAGIGCLVFAMAPLWLTPHSGGPAEYGFHGLLTLTANCYLAAGLAFLAYCGWQVYRGRPPAAPGTMGGIPVTEGGLPVSS